MAQPSPTDNSENAEPSARRGALRLLGVVAFALAYGQAPLYYSNQNQYFLHGLADAGQGSLNEDWLANTGDPTPIFSALVSITARYLHPWAFHIYHGLLLAIYAVAMLGLFSWLAPPEIAARRWPVFLFRLVVVHSAAARWLSCWLFGLDYPWYLQAGVAGQYVLGGMLQPSVFGVLLVVSVWLFARDQPFVAVAVAALAANLHSTYLLPAGLLTAGFMTALCVEKQVRRALAVGAFAFVLVLPITVYVLVKFGPTSAEAFAEAQDILVNVRIPHHCRPDLWLDPIALLQIAWIGVALALVWRTPLFRALATTAGLAAMLTIVQMATGSNTLALLFPWRISAVLVPIATTVILSRLVSIRVLSLDRPAVQAVCAGGIVILAGAGVALCAGGQAFRSNDAELPLLEYVRDHRQPGDVYLIPVRVPTLRKDIRGSKSSDFQPVAVKQGDVQIIPVDLQRFRLYTGAPIFVDFKSIPYKDVDVIEWHERLKRARGLYEQMDRGEWSQAVAEMRRHGITHLVVAAAKNPQLTESTRLPLEDPHYRIYRVIDPILDKVANLRAAEKYQVTDNANVLPRTLVPSTRSNQFQRRSPANGLSSSGLPEPGS